MRILDRYILKNIVLSYCFIALVFIGLYYLADIFSTLSDILHTKPPLKIILEYYLNLFPFIFLKISPFSLLISVVYSFGELNRNNEIIGARAAGSNIFKLVFPTIIFAILISCLALLIQEKILITSQRQSEKLKVQFIQKQRTLAPEEKNVVFVSKGVMFFSRRFLTKENILKDVIIFRGEGENILAKKIVAKEMRYANQAWEGEGVIEYWLDDEGNITSAPRHYNKLKIDFSESPREIIRKRDLYSQFASIKGLKKEIKWLKKIGAGNLSASLSIEYYRKIVEPFSHLFLTLGILAIALESRKRKAALSALGFGFIFGFIYYFLLSVSIALGKSQTLIPELSVLTAPLFFLSLGIAGLITLK